MKQAGIIQVTHEYLTLSSYRVVFEDTVRPRIGCTAAAPGRILDIAFAPFQDNRRFYAVNAAGTMSAWHIGANNGGGGSGGAFCEPVPQVYQANGNAPLVGLNCANFT